MHKKIVKVSFLLLLSLVFLFTFFNFAKAQQDNEIEQNYSSVENKTTENDLSDVEKKEERKVKTIALTLLFGTITLMIIFSFYFVTRKE